MAIKEEVCVCFFVSVVTVALSLMDVKEVEVEVSSVLSYLFGYKTA